MTKIEVTINGEQYPCRPTMGAMLRFKRETGKEVTELSEGSFTDLCTYLYCCVASASAADGKAFGLTLMEFADALDPGDLAEWTQKLTPAGETAGTVADSGEKKRTGGG